ncbi:MAG: polysaccharide deacetylase family protein [Sphingomicrobium sp.]
MSTAKARLKAGIRRATRWARTPQPAILMYHRIAQETFDPWGMAVEPDRFAAQVDWLAANRTVLPLTQFARLHHDRNLPRDAIALTFDDGYASVLDAVGLLENHGLNATIFLPAELIERGGEFWWDELSHIVVNCAADTLQADGARHAVPPPHERDRQWPPYSPPRTPRQKLFQSLWSILHGMRPASLDAAMAELRSQTPPIEPNAMDRPLSPQQVRSIDSPAISFGSHGLTHPSLPKLGPNEKLREISESRRRCAALAGSTPASFAYPFGERDNVSVRLVEEAGYVCACATGDAFVSSRSAIFALPRFNIGNWEAEHLRDMLG